MLSQPIVQILFQIEDSPADADIGRSGRAFVSLPLHATDGQKTARHADVSGRLSLVQSVLKFFRTHHVNRILRATATNTGKMGALSQVLFIGVY